MGTLVREFTCVRCGVICEVINYADGCQLDESYVDQLRTESLSIVPLRIATLGVTYRVAQKLAQFFTP